ncbi:hypothetical protein Hanom_Chr15g01366241 [Helianthus anomalus]
MDCLLRLICVVQCDWWLGSLYVTRPAVFPHVVFWGCDRCGVCSVGFRHK